MGLFTDTRGFRQVILNEAFATNSPRPHGVTPTVNWYYMGRSGANLSAPNFDTINVWGTVFRAKDATVSPDVLVKVWDITLQALLASTSLWTQLQFQVRVVGANYTEATVSSPIGATILSDAPNPVIVELQPGRCFHFFPSNRVAIDPTDVIGLFGAYKAKIISKTGADISGEVGTVVASVGADAWADNATETGNTDLFSCSYKTVQTSGRWHYGINVHDDVLRIYGPPSGFEQLTQIDSQALDPDYVP